MGINLKESIPNLDTAISFAETELLFHSAIAAGYQPKDTHQEVFACKYSNCKPLNETERKIN